MLNDVGRIVFDEIKKLFSQNENIFLDQFIVMPNHVHLIIFIRKLSVETPIYRVSGN
jgi:REP element-mobilizing transposase RayT